MSDPRALIQRAVTAPPTKPTASQRVNDETGPRLIGKAHGRMRCVNLSLTPPARDQLYITAAAHALTLGEALMRIVADATVEPSGRAPDRSGPARKGIQRTFVYVLLTPSEATKLSANALSSGRSVSDYASKALSPNAGAVQ